MALLPNPYLQRFGVYMRKEKYVRDAKACTQFVAREEEKLALISSSLLCMFITTDAHIFFYEIEPKDLSCHMAVSQMFRHICCYFPCWHVPLCDPPRKKNPFKDLEVL